MLIIGIIGLLIALVSPTNVKNHHSRSSHQRALMHPGISGLVPKVSIYGAVIVSDKSEKHIINNSTSSHDAERIRKELILINARVLNVQSLKSELPFPLTEWSAAFTQPCPIFPNGHKTERGLSWAHYRIWREFAFFDPEILLQIPQHSPGNHINRTLTSEDGIYVAHQNGTLYKAGLPFLDEDILVVFEDDADSTIKELNITLLEEFNQMTTDVLYLGWCEGRRARPVPLCLHSYAMTRKGARKLIQNFEPCGAAIDEQFVIMAKNNFFTWRKAFPYSYNRNYKPPYPVHGDKIYGIFHQNKMQLGSINGHRRR